MALPTFLNFMFLVFKNSINEIKVTELLETYAKKLNLSDEE